MSMKMEVFWDCSLVDFTLTIKTESSCEMSVNIYQTTRCTIPEDSRR
jgi:hypothetical protein